MFWLGSICVPYVALIALAIISGVFRKEPIQKFFISLGVDACILGIGVSGALFASHEIKVKLGEDAGTLTSLAIFIDLIFVGFCFGVRENTTWTENTKATWSMALGAFILILNSAIVWRYS